MVDMPTIEPSPWMKEYQGESMHYRDVHPIDDEVIHQVAETKQGPMLLHLYLSVVQAVAVQRILPYNSETEVWVERIDDTHYYQAQSVTFYDLLSMVHDMYDVYVEVEHLSPIVEAHTRQYLSDVHDYTGGFGGRSEDIRSEDTAKYSDLAQVANDDIDKTYEPTLCNAQNDAHWLRDEEPEGTNYAFVDSRGLVIEEGTHQS